MAIEFKTPEAIEKQLQQVKAIAENVMRPDSRRLDECEHERPVNFIHMMWPQMKEMERANLEASLRRVRNGDGEKAKKGKAKEPRMGNMALVHMIEMLSWGDAGIYLCIPSSALAGAAIQAVGTPEQKERFLRRFTEGEPKWGAMAMTEPQAGSDTSNIRTTATFDPETNEWVLNGQKIFCTSGKLAYEESDGLIVVWATVDPSAGRAGMKPFVVEAGTPGLKIVKLEEKLGIRASDTASFILDNCRIPADNILGDAE
ncbi:MAG: acyl-CoA dehydrogenase, partial [Caldilineae bacterium]